MHSERFKKPNRLRIIKKSGTPLRYYRPFYMHTHVGPSKHQLLSEHLRTNLSDLWFSPAQARIRDHLNLSNSPSTNFLLLVHVRGKYVFISLNLSLSVECYVSVFLFSKHFVFVAAVYLGFLAVEDHNTADEYFRFAVDWQTGHWCATAGYVSVLLTLN